MKLKVFWCRAAIQDFKRERSHVAVQLHEGRKEERAIRAAWGFNLGLNLFHHNKYLSFVDSASPFMMQWFQTAISLTRLLFYFLVGISSDPWTMVRVFDYSIAHCKSLEVSTQTENQCVPACILSPDFVCLMFSSVLSTSLILLSCILSSKVLKCHTQCPVFNLNTYLGRWDSSAPEWRRRYNVRL